MRSGRTRPSAEEVVERARAHPVVPPFPVTLCSAPSMASRIPSKSRQPKQQDSDPTTVSPASTRIVLSTPPEILSWLVDELGYVPRSSSPALQGGHWALARDSKELRLADVTRCVRVTVPEDEKEREELSRPSAWTRSGRVGARSTCCSTSCRYISWA